MAENWPEMVIKWPSMSCKSLFYFLTKIEKNRSKKKIVVYVITFDPTKIFIDWAQQNDHQNLLFVIAIRVVVKKK